MGTDIEKRTTQEEQALEAWRENDFDETDLILPLLKVSQALTAEVQNGDARPGEFINALTGENFGNVVEFVVAGFEKGRFRTNEAGEVICTGRESECPCHEVAFDECPDAEEQYAAAVNRGEKEWGKGPPCATTFNFTGFIPGTEMPVRLSLMRAQAKAAKKLLTMLRFQRAPWDVVFQLETRGTENAAGQKYQAVNIKQVGGTTAEQRQQAVGLATALQAQKVGVVGSQEEETQTSRPKQDGEGIEY